MSKGPGRHPNGVRLARVRRDIRRMQDGMKIDCMASGKPPFPSEEAARARLASIDEWWRGEKTAYMPVDCYRCWVCDKWHLTSTPTRKRAGSS